MTQETLPVALITGANRGLGLEVAVSSDGWATPSCSAVEVRPGELKPNGSCEQKGLQRPRLRSMWEFL